MCPAETSYRAGDGQEDCEPDGTPRSPWPLGGGGVKRLGTERRTGVEGGVGKASGGRKRRKKKKRRVSFDFRYRCGFSFPRRAYNNVKRKPFAKDEKRAERWENHLRDDWRRRSGDGGGDGKE